MEDSTKTVEAPVAPAAEKAEKPVETTGTGKNEKVMKKLVRRVSNEIREAGNRGKKQWQDAVKSARDLVEKAKPELKREKIGETVKKEWNDAMRLVRTRGEDLTRSRRFLTARDRGAHLLLRLATRVKDAALRVEANLVETLKYKKDDKVGAGTYVCLGCSEELKLTEAGSIPSCARCGKVEFKRKA